ncbi:hypothetical protein LIER_43570 [Lithospermum erythrorhizon]|uniref:ATP-dependent DNA helicase n=1 Tax=Lithospermum erythrorhizon TaxID=34254 RepID=A0AAV3QE79_LITER
MSNKSAIEALDKLLQDLCENLLIFGGKLMVFGGDFRQVLPIFRGGGRREQVEASLLYVALSRSKTENNVKVLIMPSTVQDPGTKYTPNVVYDEFLIQACLP